MKLGDCVEPALSAFSEDLMKEDGEGKGEKNKGSGTRREAGGSDSGRQARGQCCAEYCAAPPRGANRGA